MGGVDPTGAQYGARPVVTCSLWQVTQAGRQVQPSTDAVYIDHMNLPKTDAAALLAAAKLFHRRRVVVTLQTIELFDDREHHQPFDGEHGAPPAEVREWAFDAHERLIEFDEQISLDDGLVIERANERARIRLLVEVIDLY